MKKAVLFAVLLLSSCVKGTGGGEGRGRPEGIAYVDPATLCATERPQIVSYAQKVFVAVGYDLANISMVITPQGKVIIDTGSSPEIAEVVAREFEKISDAPVIAIIYTHSHIDHTGGAVVWLRQGKNVKIWAHSSLTENFFEQYSVWVKIQRERARRQFGFDLPDSLLPCYSIGARLFAPKSLGFIPPTNTFETSATFTAGNLTFKLIASPGETQDQIMVWIPELEVLFTGDNFYTSFPNLYTLRGSGERPPDGWIRALDIARQLGPSFLVPGHTLPLEGKNEIRKVLREYKDAIAYLWQNFVKLANEGKKPDEIANLVKLPEKFRKNPFLRETYGSVSWSLRGFYSYYIGWFDGRPENIFPMPSSTKAKLDVEAIGGAERVLFLAQQYFEKGELLKSLHFLAKLREAGLLEGEAKKLYIRVLQELAKTQQNFIARSWLLEEALAVQGELEKLPSPEIPDEVLAHIPIEVFFRAMSFRLKDEFRREGVFVSVKFVFRDVGKTFIVTVRDGIVEVLEEEIEGEPSPQVTVVTETLAYKKVALRKVKISEVIDRFEISGDFGKLLEFFRMFESEI